MKKITLSGKILGLFGALIFSSIVFSTASTTDLVELGITVDTVTHVDCPSDTSGSISISVSGGTGIYSYEWSDEEGAVISTEGPSINNLGAGSYQVSVTDDGDGTTKTSDPIEILVKDQEPPIITTTDITLPADSDLCFATGISPTATASDNCTGSVGSPLGTRDDGKPLNDPYPVGTTTITWNVTDASNNAATPVTQTVTITDEQAPIAAAKDIIVELDETGKASIAPSDIDNGSTDNCMSSLVLSLSQSIFNCSDLGANTVTLTASDGQNPDSTVEFTVTVEDNLAPVIMLDNGPWTTDPGECTATIPTPATASDNCVNVTLTGTRDDGLAMDDPYPAGVPVVITWTATDAAGNTATLDQTIEVIDNEIPVIEPAPSITKGNSAGQCYASVPIYDPVVNDNCGVAGEPLGIRNDGQSIHEPYPVGTTVITWTVEDIHGNPAEPIKQVITVKDTEKPIPAELPVIETSCAITVTPPDITDNCTPSNEIKITTDDPTTYLPQNNTSEHIIKWRFEDLSGNVDFVEQKIIISPIFNEITTTNVTCFGGTDGSISMNASGGQGPYTYALNNGTFTTDPVFTNLQAGVYTAKVKDQTGCIWEAEVTITQPDVLAYTPPADGVQTTTTAESCYGALDGTIQINGEITGGSGFYQYSVDNINFSSNPIIGLASGEYNIYVRDSKGCSLPRTLYAVVEGPEKLTAKITPTDASCYQLNSGSIEISEPAGGNSTPYSFRINGGAWQTNATPTGYIFNNLYAGSYKVEMKDASGCIRVLETVTLTQPDKLIPNLATTRTTTYGTATGTVSASPTGGNGNYTYRVTNQAGTVVGTTKTVTGLKAGNYTMTISDAAGCVVSEPFEIIEAVKAEISAISVCMEVDDTIRTSTFQVDLDGTVGGEGNTYAYKYSWDFGSGASLPPGTTGIGPFKVSYTAPGEKIITLTVTDESGVQSVHTFNHYVGECFETCDSSANFAANNDSFYIGDINGVKMKADECDDTTPMYIWFIVGKSSNVYRLYSEFIYTVSTATSTKQYKATNCFERLDSSGVPIQLRPGDKVRLNEVGPGENQIHWKCDQVLNLLHITYKWTNNNKNACGDTTQNMCASSNEVIKVATPIRAYAETTNTCKDEEAGSILIYAFGGTGEFSYTAQNNSTDPVTTYGPQGLNVFNDLPAGDYTVTVKDKKAVADSLGQVQNSFVIQNVVIQEPENALSAQVADQDLSCYNAGNGWAEVTSVTGGVGPYTYLWNNGARSTSPRIDNLSSGTYTVTITDAWGCTLVKDVEITQPPALTEAYAGSDQMRCGFTSTNLEANTAISGSGRWEITYQPAGSLPVIADPTDPKSLFTATEGKYELTWVISNADASCTTTDKVIIEIIEDCNYLDFDGLDDYVDMGTEPYNFDTGGYSIEAWVKLKSTSGTRTVLGKRDLKDPMAGGYELVITSGGYPAFKVGDLTIFPNSSVPLNTQRWYHLAVVYNGSKVTLYVDGVPVNSLPAPSPAATTAPFIIGAGHESNSPRVTKPSSHFNGWIEEVRLWKKALTPEQVHFMMNQRLEKMTAENGAVVVKGEELPMPVPGPLLWSDLAGYYQLLAKEAANGNGTTVDLSDNPAPGVLKNITTFQENTAPLPYVSKRDGNWRDITPESTPWLYGRGRWDAPNSLGVNQQPINWNIVRISHNLISGNGDITVLGLLSEERMVDDSLASRLSIYNPNVVQDEYNPGHGLRVTHYLKLNGAIDLDGESQLVQDEGSILEETSTGYIERDQQGTASSFNYNYWSSPVSPRGSANNAPYTVKSVLRDGTDPANPAPISFNYQYHWADGYYTGPLRISTYWLHKYSNFKSNTYSEWLHVGESGAIEPGEGFTMKGTSGAAAIKDRQNYTFIGKPYNGTITRVVNKGNDYLVGNPYPSAIDSHAFIRDNLKDGGGNRSVNVFNGTLYFWDHFSGHTHYLKRYVGGYATLNLSGGIEAIATDERINATGERADAALNPKRYIPVGQAFYVSTQVDPGLTGFAEVHGGEIRFKNSQRVFETEHQVDDKSIFKSQEQKPGQQKKQEDTRAKIYLRYKSPEGFHRQLLVTRDENTTSGFDLGYDAPLIEDIDEDMYWLIHKVGFVIQGVPDFNSERELPLTVKLHKEGAFTISIDTLHNIPDDLPIHLKDSLTGATHDLRKSDFTMTEVAGTIEGRFRLVFPEVESVVDEEKPEDAEKTLTSYYSSEETMVTIENPYLIPIQSATLYNLNGQRLKVFHDVPLEKVAELPIEQRASGVYLLKLQMESESKTVKFIIE